MNSILRIKGSYASKLITIVSLVIVPTGAIVTTTNNYFGTIKFAYGQPSQKDSNNTNSINIQNIPAKKVHVGGAIVCKHLQTCQQSLT